LETIRVSSVLAAIQVAQPRNWTKDAFAVEEQGDDQAWCVSDGHDQRGEADACSCTTPWATPDRRLIAAYWTPLLTGRSRDV
jgi:hypothetical protein